MVASRAKTWTLLDKQKASQCPLTMYEKDFYFLCFCLSVAYLQAASFGKSFLKDMRPQAFVEMSQTLRVLNNVRNYKVGIPLTFEEYPFVVNCVAYSILRQGSDFFLWKWIL